MDAWTEYQKEQWRKRTSLLRERNKNIRAELLKVGIKDPSPDDVRLLRQMMYDPGQVGSRAAFWVDEDGKLVWLNRPFKFMTLEEKKKRWPLFFQQ